MDEQPKDLTKTDLLEKHWFAFLKFQQAEVRKRQKSGFGVPKGDFSEEAFWSWLLDSNKLEDRE